MSFLSTLSRASKGATCAIAATFLAMSSADAQVTIVNDSFADGITNLGAEQIGFNTTSSSAALDLDQVGGPLDFASGDSGRTIHGIFPAVTLDEVGDVLDLSFEFTTPTTLTFDGGQNGVQGSGNISTNEDFRFGLFDTSQTTLAAGNVVDNNTELEIDFNGPVNLNSTTPNPAINPVAGFYGEIDNINAAGTDLGLRTHNTNGTFGINNVTQPTGQFMNTTNGWDFVSGGTDDLITLVPNTTYTGALQVTFTDASLTAFDLTVSLFDASGTLIDAHTDSISIEDIQDDNAADPPLAGNIGVNTTSFNMFALHATSGAFGGTVGPSLGSSAVGEDNNGIDISNVTIEFTDMSAGGVIKGDVDMDGDVDFSDIGPFIAVLQAGGDQAEADVDCDGTVGFGDIAPFIAILMGS